MMDSHGREIDERDRKAYAAGWRAWMAGSDGALERADARRVRMAWYDGYSDANLADQGGHKYMSLRCPSALRHWNRDGSDCGCDTCHRIRVEESERLGAPAPERPAEVVEASAGTDTPAEPVEAVSEAEGAAAGPDTPAMDALAAAAAAGVETVEARGWHVSPAREVLARVVTLGVEVSFARSDHYGGPVSRQEMADALAEIRAGFEAAGFRTGQRLPYGEPFATVWGGGWCDEVTTARLSEIVRAAVAEIGHPAVSLWIDGEREPVFLSTLDAVPEHLRLT